MRDGGERQTIVPRLRFPDFRGVPGWRFVALRELLSRSPDYGVNAPAVGYSEELPTYLRITDIDEDGQFIAAGNVSVNIEATEEQYLSEGDIALARTGASVGKSYRYRQKDGRLVFAGFLIRVRPAKEKVLSAFLSNFMTSHQYSEWVRATSSRSGQPGINGSELANAPVPIPYSDSDDYGLVEQEKIADCLTSLEEIIAAQRQHLDALKAHKRGLMQQLFPREGASRPRLRFPEFRNGSEWVGRAMAELVTKVSPPVSVKEDTMYREIGVRSHGKGVFHKEPVNGKSIGNKRVFWVEPTALVLNIIFAWEQAVATTSKGEAGMIASHRFPMYIAIEGRCDV